MSVENYTHVFELALSPSEHECLQSLSESKIVKAIAHHLALSPCTVEFHLRNLMRKIEGGERCASPCGGRLTSATGD